jgi:hypothetical protein
LCPLLLAVGSFSCKLETVNLDDSVDQSLPLTNVLLRLVSRRSAGLRTAACWSPPRRTPPRASGTAPARAARPRPSRRCRATPTRCTRWTGAPTATRWRLAARTGPSRSGAAWSKRALVLAAQNGSKGPSCSGWTGWWWRWWWWRWFKGVARRRAQSHTHTHARLCTCAHVVVLLF